MSAEELSRRPATTRPATTRRDNHKNTWEDNRNAPNATGTLETQTNPLILTNPTTNPITKPESSTNPELFEH